MEVGLTVGGTATILFTDQAGSTSMLDRLGDDAGEEVRRRHFQLLREAVAEHGGHEVKNLGDGLMVAFSSALAAVACALTMQKKIADDNGGAHEVPVGLRVGINSGEVINAEDDLFGTPVVVAKRLCDRAEAGQTLVSEITRGLVGSRGAYDFAELGALHLKGFADPVVSYELRHGAHLLDATPEAPGPGVSPDADDQVPLPHPLVQEMRGHMVGRTAEFGALENYLDKVASGVLQMVLVGGEPGIGKTKLAAEFAGRAHAAGSAVLFGRSEPEQLVPFQPVVEALSDFAASMTAQSFAERFRDLLPALCRLSPPLSQRFPDAAAHWRSTDAETDRYLLFEAASQFFQELSRERPLVLVLDDLQWADKPTLSLLRHVVRSAGASPILVLATYRDVEVGREHPLGAMLTERHRGAPIHLLVLEGLAKEGVAELSVAWAGQRVPEELVTALWEETEGHPFYVQEVLRHLLETGSLYERRGQLTTASGVAGIGLPESVREVVEQRLTVFDDNTIGVLRLAAVIGREFEVTLLDEVSEELHGDRLLRVLDEASALRVVAPAPSTPERYRFSHTLIREVLYESLSPAWRVRLHQRVASALESADATSLPLADLARHYFAAASASETFVKAVDYAVAAGRSAVEQLAHEEAVDHFERALRALELNQGDEARRADIMIELGQCRWDMGDFASARQAFSGAARLADTAGVPDLLASAALGFAGQIGFQDAVVDAEMIAMLGRALERLPRGPSSLRARVTARLCESLALSEPLERRAQLADEAVAMARELGDRRTLVDVLLCTWWGTYTPDNIEERRALTEELLREAEALGDTRRIIEASLWLSLNDAEEGDLDKLSSLVERVDTLMAGSRNSYLRYLLNVCRSVVATLNAPMAELEPLIWDNLMLGQSSQNTTAVAIFAGQLGYARYFQGRLGELHATVGAVADHFAAIYAFQAFLPVIYAEMGLGDEAREQFERLAADDFADVPRDRFWLTCMNLLSLACAHLEDRARAQVLYDLLLPFADRLIVIGGVAAPHGSAHTYLGLLATVLDRFDVAEEHFLAAISADRKLGASHSSIRTQVDYAQMLLRRGGPGDREKVEQIVEDVLPEAKRLGLDAFVAKARVIRRRLSGQEQAAPPSREGRLRVITGGAKAALSTRGRNAVAKVVAGSSDEELRRRFGSSVAQRALFTAMAQGFQPRMAFGFNGAIQVGLSDGTEMDGNLQWWSLEVSGRKTTLHHGVVDNPAVVIRSDVPTFMRVFSGDLNPVTAWLSGDITVEGDVTLGPRLVELFGGVKPFALEAG